MKLLSKMQRGRRRRFMDVLKEEMQNVAVTKKMLETGEDRGTQSAVMTPKGTHHSHPTHPQQKRSFPSKL